MEMNPSNDLREVMRRWVSGVAVLTASDGKSRHGMTVNSFTSVSIDPPRVTVTMANNTRSRRLVEDSGFFTINLLDEDQQALSDRFAGKIEDGNDRFHDLMTKPGENGCPILVEAHAYVECKVIHSFEMENSTLYIGAVQRAEKCKDQLPLVYFNRNYHRIIP